MGIVFNNPVFLWFLLAVPILIITHFLSLKYGKKEALRFSNFEAISRVVKKRISEKPYPRIFMNKNLLLLIIRATSLSLLIFSVAGTVLWYRGETTDFDFVLAIDTSSSMLADDFSPNRLEATKVAANMFVDSLAKKSMVGLVTFSGTSFVEQKPSEDLELLKKMVDSIKVSRMGGTDLGTAIITSSNLLIAGDKGKAIILLTDGQSNVGADVLDGIEYANKVDVMVHTIGVGTEEGGKFKETEIISKIDEVTLKRIASMTGGGYFRANNKEELVKAYKGIAGLNIRKMSLNLTPAFMFVALMLLILEWVLVNTKYMIVA